MFRHCTLFESIVIIQVGRIRILDVFMGKKGGLHEIAQSFYLCHFFPAKQHCHKQIKLAIFFYKPSTI